MSPGSFATAEEAALCAARSPEGQAAARAAAAAPPLTSEAEVRDELHDVPFWHNPQKGATVPARVARRDRQAGEHGPASMLPDAVVKVEVVVKQEDGSDGSRPKRRKTTCTT